MAKQKFDRSERNCSIGIIGYPYNKKNALSLAICAEIASQGNEVKLQSTCAQFDLSDCHYTLITDSLQFCDFIKNLLMGEAVLENMIVAISATCGVMPQMREYLLLAYQLGVKKIAVFIDDCNQVKDTELCELVKSEVCDLLSKYGFDSNSTPIIFGSTSGVFNGEKEWIDKIQELVDACVEYFAVSSVREDLPFLMAIEDVFVITGRGTVASGRVERGCVHLNDKVECLGFGKKKEYVVTGVEMFRKLLDEAVAGDNIGLLLRGAEKKDLARGMVLAAPGTVELYSEFDAELYVFAKDEGGRHTPFMNNYRPQFYIRITDVTGTIQILGGIEMVVPGEKAKIHVTLVESMVLNVGLHFVIREGGRTVGAGIITRLGPTAVNPPMPEKQTFLMNVDDAFVITGRGTVITGSIVSGTIHTGDCVARVGSTTGYTVSSITVSSSVVNEAKAGDNVALLLRGADKNAFARGNQITVLN